MTRFRIPVYREVREVETGWIEVEGDQLPDALAALAEMSNLDVDSGVTDRHEFEEASAWEYDDTGEIMDVPAVSETQT